MILINIDKSSNFKCYSCKAVIFGSCIGKEPKVTCGGCGADQCSQCIVKWEIGHNCQETRTKRETASLIDAGAKPCPSMLSRTRVFSI